jgi:DNA-binding transcriptional regulator YiaG
MNICSVDGCDKKRHVKIGYCSKHYARFKKHGDPLGGRKGSPRGAPLKWIEEHADYDLNDCIRWPFAVSRYGYGIVTHNGKRRVASRVMCEKSQGLPEDPSMDAAHVCGNGAKGCMNPNHLSWKTRKENMADAVDHKTWKRGDMDPRASISNAQASEIAALKGVIKQSEIAKKFGVSAAVVAKIHNGSHWKEYVDKGALVKSRFSYGKDHYCAKITEVDVREIRRLRGQKSQSELAQIYGIDKSQVGKIQRRVWWKWVE